MDFFDQFEKLRLNVPRLSIMNLQAENSQYCNFTYKAVDCYFSIGSDFIKNSHYNYWAYHNTNCIDCSYCRDSENCYECLDCKGCINSLYLQDCDDCNDCFYCFDCQSLRDCFACIDLWRKQYYIYNKPYTKEEYFKTVEKLRHKSPEELRKLFKEVKKARPHIYMHQSKLKNECTGDYIYNSDSCKFCFDIEKCKDSLYLNNAINCNSCADVSFAGEAPLNNCYEIMSGMGLTDCNFCSVCWYGKNLKYCDYCFDCEDCFGCVGLKNKKFCILNISYKADQYFERIAKMKNEKWFLSTYQ